MTPDAAELDCVDLGAGQVSEFERVVDWYRTRFNTRVLNRGGSRALLRFANIRPSLVTPRQHPAHVAQERVQLLVPRRHHVDLVVGGRRPQLLEEDGVRLPERVRTGFRQLAQHAHAQARTEVRSEEEALAMIGALVFLGCPWRALLRLPRGYLWSYAELAARAGSPGAARAAGSAMTY